MRVQHNKFCVLVVAAALGSLGMAGCTKTRTTGGYYRPLPPEPRPIQLAPADARANALVINVSAAPLDTNGNGYPDLIYATAHLFDTRYPPAIREEGAFMFRLYASGQAGEPGVEPIRSWRIEGDGVDQAQARSAFGECYYFRLSLLDGGTDKLPINMADIMCWFEPADGSDPTYAGEVTSIRIGRRILVPQLSWDESAKASRAPASSPSDAVLEPIK
ncbi:MAG: hypothetical protein ACYSU7_13600 [Planctomycetota bacterium]|jgi:hypothetical protein